jgi:hypothetical protein
MWYISGGPLSQIKIKNMKLITLCCKTKKAFTVFIITKIQNGTDTTLDSKTLKGQNKFQVQYACICYEMPVITEDTCCCHCRI